MKPISEFIASIKSNYAPVSKGLLGELLGSPGVFLAQKRIAYDFRSHEIDSNPTTKSIRFSVFENTYYCPQGHLLLSTVKPDFQNNFRGKICTLFTPMREQGSNTRLCLPDKCAPENNAIWLTPPQTGCVVAVVKYVSAGDQELKYSMIHLQPRDWDHVEDIDKKLKAMETEDAKGIAKFQDSYLCEDLLNIFEQIGKDGDMEPFGYLVSFSAADHHCHELKTQVVGIMNENQFVFYEQKVPYGEMPPEKCKELNFLPWESIEKIRQRLTDLMLDH